MIQTLLARNSLMVGLGTGLDSSENLANSGQRGYGARPTIFYGPKRDALSLITKRVATLLIIRPKKHIDFETKTYVLGFTANDSAVTELWKKQVEEGSQQIFPKSAYLELKEIKSHLLADADIYEQEFVIQGDELKGWQKDFSLKVSSLIHEGRFMEKLNIDLAEDFDCWLAHWHKPEIGASDMFQSIHGTHDNGTVCSFRSNVFFSVAAQQDEKPLPFAFVETGWNQNEHYAYNRLPDVLSSLSRRDDLLGYHYSAHHQNEKPWLGMESYSFEAIGSTDTLALWPVNHDKSIILSYSLSDHIDKALEFETLDFEKFRETVMAADRAWLASKKPAPEHLSQKAKDYYSRTLLTLRQMQDPGGGIIAAPEFHYQLTNCGGYGYCWGRDAGFISYAMDVCGLYEESAEFYRYMAKCQSADGSFLHRHDMDGNLGASWGFLQPDETGSVVYGVWQHISLADNKELATELRDMITRGTEWLVNSKHGFDQDLPIEGHDLWEERLGVHYYSVGAMLAGIDAGIKIYEYMNWEAPKSWASRSEELKALIHSERFLRKDGDQYFFARTLQRVIGNEARLELETHGAKINTVPTETGRVDYYLAEDFIVDISQLGAGYPYGVFDYETHGEAWDQLIDQVHEQLWRPGIGGIGRYEADFYRDGNPWILSTLWLGLAAEERGKLDIAKKCWQWTLEHTSPEGTLPEQVDPKTGRPAWVMPLTWSHAMFALAVHQLSKEVTQ